MKNLFFISLILFSASCIPISDEVDPQIRQFDSMNVLNNTFFYLDTIQLDFKVFDNGLLDTINVKIEPAIFFGDSSDFWFVDSSYAIRGRLWTDTFRVMVPATNEANELIDTGEYVLTLTAYDDFDNPAQESKAFRIGSDRENPDLNGLDIVYVSETGQRTFLSDVPAGQPIRYCRNDSIILVGSITDNIALRNIAFDLNYTDREGNPTQTRYPPTQIQGGDGLIRDLAITDVRAVSNLRIPLNVENGDFSLVIKVNDLESNEAVRQFDFQVDCDDEAPVVNVDLLTPRVRQRAFSTVFETDVVQGGFVSLDSVIISDNAGINQVYYVMVNSNGEIVESDTLVFTDLVKPTSLFFKSLKDTIDFPSQDVPVGSAFALRLGTVDTVGIVTEQVVELQIIEDEAPEIIITGILVNDSYTLQQTDSYTFNDTYFDDGSELSYLMINGKIKDQFRLRGWSTSLFRIEADGSETLINSIPNQYRTDENGELLLPVNLPSYIERNLTFPVQKMDYRIEVVATDSRNQTVIESILLDYQN